MKGVRVSAPPRRSDDPTRYRTDAQVNEWKQKDPILRLQLALRSAGALAEADDAKILADARALVAQAVEQAEATPAVEPRTLFDDTFKVRTPQLEEELAEFDRLLSEGVIRP